MQTWAHKVPAGLKHFLSYALLLIPVLSLLFAPRAQAGPQVLNRYNLLSTSEQSAVATHSIGFRYTNYTAQVGSVSFEFCANSPIAQIPCVPPSGFDASGAVLAAQTGQTGFSISSLDSTSNKLVIYRGAATPNAPNAESVYRFTNVVNPDTNGTYFVRIQTFSTMNGSGVAIEEGGIAFVITSPFNVNAEVPPHLLFCAATAITNYDCSSATSFFIDLGEFSISRPVVATSQMVVASNAGFGFSIAVAGTTLTSGNNIITPALTPAPSSPGSSQFGLNLRANNNPSIGANPTGPGTALVTSNYGQLNQFKFTQGDAVVTSASTSDYRKFTVSYLTNISSQQPAGVYATTVSYIALAHF